VKTIDYPDLSFEIALWSQGANIVVGIDEAGRGALAGPVAAAAVVLPPNSKFRHQLEGVRDSKMMTPGLREYWAVHIREVSLCNAVGFASHQEIDEFGIVPATRLAIHRAIDQLTVSPQYLLLDFIKLPECSTPQICLVKGDARCLSIASASILAKTTRDEVMRELDLLYPSYGFAKHKGYGTVSHRQALSRLGACPIHRHTFRYKIIQSTNTS